jgi:hypothetical protein
MIEHASQSEDDGLGDLVVAVRIYSWPVTAIELGLLYLRCPSLLISYALVRLSIHDAMARYI